MTDITNTNNTINTDPNKLMLKSIWVVYVYDKQVFNRYYRELTSNKPYIEICKLKTVADLAYFIKFMGEFVDMNNTQRVFDKKDYVIMRDGIKPIWEDEKNINGGTFTIKMDHERGYSSWVEYVMSIVGETFSEEEEMEHINGFSYSFISGQNNVYNPRSITDKMPNSSYFKIWDGKRNRTEQSFMNIMSPDLINLTQPPDTMRYTPNNEKKNFGDSKVINRLKDPYVSFSDNSGSGRGRGSGGYHTNSSRGGFRGRGSGNPRFN